MIQLRLAELRDVDAIYKYRCDEEVMFWGAGGFGLAMHSRAQVEEQIRSERSDSLRRTFMIEVATEQGPFVIGYLTYNDLNIVNHSCNISMLIGERAYWGQGYGTAALQAFLRLLFTRLNVHRIDIDTFADNTRAIRCYEKCGFVVEGVRRKKMWTMNGYRDQVLMGLLREDWLQAHGDDVYYL